MDDKFSPLKSIIDNIDIIKNNNINIDNANINNAQNGDSSKYALKDNYEPRTDVAFTAVEISTFLHDTNNFARHYKIVKTINPSEARRLFQETVDDVRKARKDGRKIENPAGLYNWKVNQLLKKLKRV